MNRIEKLTARFPANVDAVLINSEVNRRYFTGLPASAGTLLATHGAAYFIIDFRYIEIARRTVKDAEVILQDNLTEQLRELLVRHKVKNIAVETGYLTVGELEQFRKSLPDFEFTTDSAVNDAILDMRSCKESVEIEAMRHAQKITDTAFTQILDFIKPGLTEKEIAARLEYNMKLLGADGLAFETIAVAGPNSALPHGIPGERPVQKGDFLTLDFGALYDGYCSDMTRTVAIGEPTDEMRKVYELVREAQAIGIREAAVGVPCFEVDRKVRDFIYDNGYEGCFGHGTGHSVGIEIHEMPVFSRAATADMICRNGEILTVEPGIYLEGRFGCRIEDMILFEDNKTVDLTNSPKELIIL